MLYYARSLLRGANTGTVLDTQTITTGASGLAPDRVRGWQSPGIGSISDGTSNIYSGSAITGFFWDEAGSVIELDISGTLSNSGWTQVTINGVVFTRASAGFVSVSGTTTWTWSSSYTAATQPFGTAGSTIPCIFT